MVVKLNILELLTKSHLSIFENSRKLLTPIFLLTIIASLILIMIEFAKPNYSNSGLFIFLFILIAIPITYILTIPIGLIHLVLSGYNEEKISVFILNPYASITYGYQFFSPFWMASLLLYTPRIIYPILREYEIILYSMLGIFTLFLVRISLTFVISLKEICKNENYKNVLVSDKNYSKSWYITKGHTLSISLILFISNLPVTLFLVFRYYYLTSLEPINGVSFPLKPNDFIIGGDSFLSYFLSNFSWDNSVLNIFTFVFLIWSVLISSSIRINILKKIDNY